MSSGNLDALSAIATVLNPNISDEFPDNNVVDETLMAPPTDPQMMEEPFPLSQDTVKDTGQAVDDDAEAETFCDLDESTKEAGQQLQPRLIQEDLKNDWQNELNASGFVSCSVPGCQMRYSAIFSFERHYKWCTGEKGEGLETCEYCTCQFLATLQGIEDHVRKEHPSEINDYRAKRVARKIIKESREKEKKAREEKEARALELKREKQSLRATYQKRQTCYSKRQPVVKSDSENSRDDGSDKKVRFKAVVSVIHPDKLEDDESNVDDPVAQSLKEKVLDKPKRQPPKTKETAEVLQPARNWGVQRKTYSRSGGSTSDTSAKDVSQSDSETFLESNIAETSDAEVLAPENTILHEEFISVSHEKGISVEPVESNSILPEKVETVSQDAVPLPQESETSEEIVQSSEVPMDVSEEVVTFFNSGTEENVLIPIETEGCVTIGNEVQEPEEENYQLVIVTGESGESQYIVLDESLSQAFAEGVAANENELPESENSSFNVVSIPDEELAIAPANNLNETTNEIEVSSVEVNDSTNNKVLDNVQFQEVEEAGEITVEANSLPIAQSDENVIIECVSTMDSNTVIIEGESSEPSVVEVTQKDPIGVKIIPAARGVETASKGKINEPKKVIIKKRKPKISQSYKFASDSDDPKDPTIDRFQLPVPSNLSSINIGEDFLPPNLEKLLEFGGGKSDKHLKKGDMIADENSSSFPEPWTESVKISENKTNSPTITMSNTSGIFTKVINRNNDVFPSKPTMSEKLLNNVEKNQRDISAVDTIKRSSKTSANDYSKEDHSDNKSASLSDSCHSQSNDGASSSAAQISTSIQSLAGISGNPQIKIYMPKSDGTLAPLEDFSILSSNPQIRIMTPERDGTLKPMVVGDKKLILKSVQKMIATGSSSGTLKAHDNKISLLPEQTDKHTGKPQEIDIETTSTNTMTSLFDENVLQISNDNSHTIEIPNTSNNGFEDNLEQVNEFVSSTPNSCNDTVENKEVQVQVEKQSVKISQNDSSVSISEVESTTPSDVPIKRKRGRPPRNDPRFQGLSSGFRKAPLICNSDDDGPPPVKAMRQNSSLVQRKFVNTKIIARNNDINLELQSTMEESLSNDFGSLKKKMSLSSPLDSVSDSDSNIATPIRRGPTMRGGRYSRRRRGGRRGGWGRGRQIEETSMNNSLSLINDVDLDDNENDETTSFQCSACKLIFDNKTNAKNHIFSKHHGLAKINDETPLTDSEINVVLRNVLKVKRSLGCLNDDCGRFFRSTPGYLNHMKMCGVETSKATTSAIKKPSNTKTSIATTSKNSAIIKFNNVPRVSVRKTRNVRTSTMNARKSLAMVVSQRKKILTVAVCQPRKITAVVARQTRNKLVSKPINTSTFVGKSRMTTAAIINKAKKKVALTTRKRNKAMTRKFNMVASKSTKTPDKSTRNLNKTVKKVVEKATVISRNVLNKSVKLPSLSKTGNKSQKAVDVLPTHRKLSFDSFRLRSACSYSTRAKVGNKSGQNKVIIGRSSRNKVSKVKVELSNLQRSKKNQNSDGILIKNGIKQVEAKLNKETKVVKDSKMNSDSKFLVRQASMSRNYKSKLRSGEVSAVKKLKISKNALSNNELKSLIELSSTERLKNRKLVTPKAFDLPSKSSQKNFKASEFKKSTLEIPKLTRRTTSKYAISNNELKSLIVSSSTEQLKSRKVVSPKTFDCLSKCSKKNFKASEFQKLVTEIPKLTRRTTYLQNLDSTSRAVRKSTQLVTKCSTVEAAQRSLSKSVTRLRHKNFKFNISTIQNAKSNNKTKSKLTNSKHESHSNSVGNFFKKSKSSFTSETNCMNKQSKERREVTQTGSKLSCRTRSSFDHTSKSTPNNFKKCSIAKTSGSFSIRKTPRARTIKLFFDEIMTLHDLELKNAPDAASVKSTKNEPNEKENKSNKIKAKPHSYEKVKVQCKKSSLPTQHKPISKVNSGKIVKAKLKIHALKRNKKGLELAVNSKFHNRKKDVIEKKDISKQVGESSSTLADLATIDPISKAREYLRKVLDIESSKIDLESESPDNKGKEKSTKRNFKRKSSKSNLQRKSNEIDVKRKPVRSCSKNHANVSSEKLVRPVSFKRIPKICVNKLKLSDIKSINIRNSSVITNNHPASIVEHSSSSSTPNTSHSESLIANKENSNHENPLEKSLPKPIVKLISRVRDNNFQSEPLCSSNISQDGKSSNKNLSSADFVCFNENLSSKNVVTCSGIPHSEQKETSNSCLSIETEILEPLNTSASLNLDKELLESTSKDQFANSIKEKFVSIIKHDHKDSNLVPNTITNLLSKEKSELEKLDTQKKSPQEILPRCSSAGTQYQKSELIEMCSSKIKNKMKNKDDENTKQISIRNAPRNGDDLSLTKNISNFESLQNFKESDVPSNKEFMEHQSNISSPKTPEITLNYLQTKYNPNLERLENFAKSIIQAGESEPNIHIEDKLSINMPEKLNECQQSNEKSNIQTTLGKSNIQVAEESNIQVAEESNIQVAEESNIQLAEESNIQLVEESNIQLAEESNIQLAEENNIQLAEESNIQLAEESNIQLVGESNIQLEGESNIQLEGESNIQLEGESNIQLEGESHIQLEGESHIQLEGESHIQLEGESHIQLEGESHIQLEGESHIQLEGESHIQLEGESHIQLEGESHIQLEGESHIQLAGESHIQLAGESHIQLAGESHTQLAGESHTQLAGESHIQLAGESHTQLAGESHTQLAGESHTQLAGESHTQLAGESHIQLAGESHIQLAGESHIQLAGESHIQLAGESHIQLAGESHIQLAEETHIQLAGESHIQLEGESHIQLEGESHIQLEGESHIQIACEKSNIQIACEKSSIPTLDKETNIQMTKQESDIHTILEESDFQTTVNELNIQTESEKTKISKRAKETNMQTLKEQINIQTAEVTNIVNEEEETNNRKTQATEKEIVVNLTEDDLVVQTVEEDLVLQSMDEDFVLQSTEEDLVVETTEEGIVVQTTEEYFIFGTMGEDLVVQSIGEDFNVHTTKEDIKTQIALPGSSISASSPNKLFNENVKHFEMNNLFTESSNKLIPGLTNIQEQPVSVNTVKRKTRCMESVLIPTTNLSNTSDCLTNYNEVVPQKRFKTDSPDDDKLGFKTYELAESPVVNPTNLQTNKYSSSHTNTVKELDFRKKPTQKD